MLIHELIFLVMPVSLFVSEFFVVNVGMLQLIYTGKLHESCNKIARI